MNDAKVLDKVRKLLSLANNAGATEGERDNAMRMAHALLAKHNLSEDDLDVKENRVKEQLNTYGSPWARSIAASIARLYFCKYFYSKGKSVIHNFVGKESNAVTASLMTNYVIKSALKEAGKKCKEEGMSHSFKTSFLIGTANAVRDRVDQMIAAQANDVHTKGNGTEITLASVYKTEAEENAAWVSEHVGGLSTGRTKRSSVRSDGYSAGQAYGATVGLNTQVASGRQAKINC